MRRSPCSCCADAARGLPSLARVLRSSTDSVHNPFRACRARCLDARSFSARACYVQQTGSGCCGPRHGPAMGTALAVGLHPCAAPARHPLRRVRIELARKRQRQPQPHVVPRPRRRCSWTRSTAVMRCSSCWSLLCATRTDSCCCSRRRTWRVGARAELQAPLRSAGGGMAVPGMARVWRGGRDMRGRACRACLPCSAGGRAAGRAAAPAQAATRRAAARGLCEGRHGGAGWARVVSLQDARTWSRGGGAGRVRMACTLCAFGASTCCGILT